MIRYVKTTFVWKWGRAAREGLRSIYFALHSPVLPDTSRYTYQQRYIRHRFSPEERVLDVGSGGDPFPYATILADLYLQPTRHRSEEFQSRGKPVVVCDIHALPFADGCFDYVVCSHVLEHVDDPIQACQELQRVAPAGLIETPTLMKDALFAWAKGMHKWHIVAIHKRLVFFEYSERQLAGIGSQEWAKLIFGSGYHPLQVAFNDNQDLLNVIFEWKDCFEVIVMRLDGTIQMLREDP